MEFLNTQQLTELIKKSNTDFLDFGCSGGGSIEYAKKYLGGKNGIGIDIDKKKVDFATKAGHNAVLFNIEELPNDKLVDFVILSVFLNTLEIQKLWNYLLKKQSISQENLYISNNQVLMETHTYFLKDLKLTIPIGLDIQIECLL